MGIKDNIKGIAAAGILAAAALLGPQAAQADMIEQGIGTDMTHWTFAENGFTQNPQQKNLYVKVSAETGNVLRTIMIDDKDGDGKISQGDVITDMIVVRDKDGKTQTITEISTANGMAMRAMGNPVGRDVTMRITNDNWTKEIHNQKGPVISDMDERGY